MARIIDPSLPVSACIRPMVIQLPEIVGSTWILYGGKDPTTHLLATFLLVASTLWFIARLTQPRVPSVIFHRVREGFPLLAMFSTSLIRNGWLHRNVEMTMVTHRTFNSSKIALMYCSGELMYIRALGKGILMINSRRAAVDLLEKRSNTSSDRPRYISCGDFLTKNLLLTFKHYDDRYVSCFLSYNHVDPL